MATICTGFYLVLLDSAEVLMGFTGFYRVFMGFTGFYLVLLNSAEVSMGFTGLYWVLLG